MKIRLVLAIPALLGQSIVSAQIPLNPPKLTPLVGPTYEPPEVTAKRIHEAEAAEQQVEMNAQAIRMNELKLRQEQLAVDEMNARAKKAKAGGQSVDETRFAALEERLGKLETAFAEFLKLENARWELLDKIVKANEGRAKQ